MLGQIVDRKRRLSIIQWWRLIWIGMVGGPVFFEQLWFSIPFVVRMRKSKKDQERFSVRIGFSLVEVLYDSIRMPGTPRLVGRSTLGSVVSNREQSIRFS